MTVISTNAIDTADICTELHRQKNIDGYGAAVIFIDSQLDSAEILSLLDVSIPHIGCTTLSVYHGSKKEEKTVTIWLFPAECKPVVGPLKDIADNARSVFALSNLDPELSLLSIRFSFFGGCASDTWNFKEAAVFLNGRILNNTTVAITYDAQQQTQSHCNWMKIPNTDSIVTDAKGPLVKAIGNMTAIEFYHQFMPVNEAFGAYPLILPEYDAIRAPFYFNSDCGSITFSNPIPIGTKVFASTIRRNSLKHSITKFFQAEQRDADDSFTVMISCAARNLLLSDIPQFEHEQLSTISANILTLYLYGEFIPCGEHTTLQNHYATITKIGCY